MSEAEKYYREHGGCSCHLNPPCSFCMLLNEEEATIMWNGTYEDLEKYWRENKKAS